jgi:hypothetical protein
MPRSKLAVSLLFVSLTLSACAGSGDAPKERAEPKSAPEAGKSPDDGPIAGTPVEGDQKVARAPAAGGGEEGQYTLQIEPSDAVAGEPGQIRIRVVPRGEWHMNLGYPTKLAITAPAGVEVAKPDLAKDDAIKLDEDSCEFEVGFVAAEAGDKTFTGEFKFAICQDEACVPKTEKLEFHVAVK